VRSLDVSDDGTRVLMGTQGGEIYEVAARRGAGEVTAKRS